MAKYLIAGGAGFIGSRIAARLVKEGHYVRILDNLFSGRKENFASFMEKIDFQEGDIRDKDDVRKAVKDMDFILHHAALIDVVSSINDPAETNEVNVSGTLNLLIEAAKSRVKRFIYASSSAVYGSYNACPQKETMPLDPVSPYAVSKFTGESYCKIFSKEKDIETVVFRYFNVFGPGQVSASRYAAVIPSFISSLLDKKSCIINGDGAQYRDFIFVDNVVDINVLACEKSGISGKTFNVACGSACSIIELEALLRKILNIDIKPIYGPCREGDIRESYADITVLKNVFGFTPKIGLYEGLKRTVEWFMQDGAAGRGPVPVHLDSNQVKTPHVF